MKKLLLLLPFFFVVATQAQVGARFKNKLLAQDFRTAPAGQPIMFDGSNNVVVDYLPASSITGVISSANGAGIPAPTVGSKLWANADNVWERIDGNSSDTLKVDVQYSNGKPFPQEIIPMVLNSETTGDGFVKALDGSWRNLHSAYLSPSVRRQRMLGSTVFVETVDMYAMSADQSALTDGQLRCATFEIINPRIAAKVGYILATAGDFTGDNTNSFSIYSTNVSSGVQTKILETSNSEALFETTQGYREANLASSDTLEIGVYAACALMNNSASTTAPQLGVKTSWSSTNGGLNTQGFSNSLKVAFTLNSQNTAPSSFNMSSTSVSNNAIYVQIKE